MSHPFRRVDVQSDARGFNNGKETCHLVDGFSSLFLHLYSDKKRALHISWIFIKSSLTKKIISHVTIPPTKIEIDSIVVFDPLATVLRYRLGSCSCGIHGLPFFFFFPVALFDSNIFRERKRNSAGICYLSPKGN